MRILWRKERATDSNSVWLVGVEAERISVLAPPGVAIVRQVDAAQRRMTGWSWGIWNRDCADNWPQIDEEPPLGVREVSTRDAVLLLGEDLQELVWNCLWHQLQVARRIGRQHEDAIPSEDLARAGAVSVTWLTDELSSAFPDRSDLLEPFERSECLQLADPTPDPAELMQPLSPQREDLVVLGTKTHTRTSLLGLLAWKLFAKRLDDWTIKHQQGLEPDRHPDQCDYGYGAGPADRSGFGWGEAAPGEVEAGTEELAHL
jgi:hypothetical protein